MAPQSPKIATAHKESERNSPINYTCHPTAGSHGTTLRSQCHFYFTKQKADSSLYWHHQLGPDTSTPHPSPISFHLHDLTTEVRPSWMYVSPMVAIGRSKKNTGHYSIHNERSDPDIPDPQFSSSKRRAYLNSKHDLVGSWGSTIWNSFGSTTVSYFMWISWLCFMILDLIYDDLGNCINYRC